VTVSQIAIRYKSTGRLVLVKVIRAPSTMIRRARKRARAARYQQRAAAE
jgi:hypothetical protein